MKADKLIGLTIAEAVEQITKAEKGAFFQYYICTKEHKQRNLFKECKKWHYHNEKGERVYKVYDYDKITFANDEKLQQNSFILECEIKQETHDLWSFNGYERTATHSVYFLYIDGIAKGNKGNTITMNKTEQLIPYKKGELTKAQRRFTL